MVWVLDRDIYSQIGGRGGVVFSLHFQQSFEFIGKN